ncbi:MAG: cellulase family glycosylhydrolase [Candidatus Dormibacter sp.]
MAILALGVASGDLAGTASPTSAAAASLSIRIVGNHFVGQAGRPILLRGVNRSGTEYECMDGRGVFDGPDDAASIAIMASWHINAVRVPLNEDCWLGINGAPAAYSGTPYRDAIRAYVRRLHDAGLYAIVDLHWSAQGTLPADGRTGQGRAMADADHAPAFWQSVAATFRDDPAVLLDLFNEPHDISWDCWANGCTVQDATGSWQVAGFQSLLDTVRATGATNPVLVAGNRWAGDLRGWPHGLRDSAHQLAASWHVYSPGTRLDALRDLVVRPIAGTYPVVVAEVGEKDCASRWLTGFLRWADDAGISYLAWTWDTWPDCGNPVLITSYQGAPTAYGAGYRDHLAALWRDHPAPRVLSAFEADLPLMTLAVGAGLLGLGLAAFLFFTVRRLRQRKSARRVAAL